VIVVGHTECGGAKHCVGAASKPLSLEPPKTPLGRWLEPLTILARDLHLESLPPSEALLTLVKASVKRQVEHLAATETIKAAWGRNENVWIHGLLYDLSTGNLSDLEVSLGPGS
jgi:carbonic anhydrase